MRQGGNGATRAAARPFSAAGRRANLTDLADREVDLLIVGGGITGAGIALEATRRGFSVGLVEASDFASGTSSRSSKLVHGGLRYLAQYEFGLVHEALLERRRLAEAFPGLVKPLAFLMPIPRHLLLASKLSAGFWVYDALSLGSGFPRHRRINVEAARRLAPALQRTDIRGAWKYWDAQTDDAVLTVEVLRRAHDAGALVANYAAVTKAARRDGGWDVDIEDRSGGGRLRARCRYLVNAGGVWAEIVEGLAGREAATRIRPSKGVHVAISGRSLPIGAALAFPVGDGRLQFAVPWKGHVIVGTTDEDYEGDIDAPGCTPEEAADMIKGVNRFFDLDLTPADVLSRWAGVRPLVKNGDSSATKDISRKPHVELEDGNLLTVTGGKLTTFMRMADDALAMLPPSGRDRVHPALVEARQVTSQLADPDMSTPLPGAAGYDLGDIARACDEEMALELEDALSRRLRLAFVDVESARAAAPLAAGVMSARLGWGSGVGERLRRFDTYLETQFGASPTRQEAVTSH